MTSIWIYERCYNVVVSNKIVIMRFIVFYVYGWGTLAMALNNFFILMF